MSPPSSLTHLPGEPPSEKPTQNLPLLSSSKSRKQNMGNSSSRRNAKGAQKSKPPDELLSDAREGDIVVLYVSASRSIGSITPTTTQCHGHNRSWKEHGGYLLLGYISATPVTLINSSSILT